MEFPQSYGLQLHLQTPHQQHQHCALLCNFLTDDGQSVASFEFLGTIVAGGQDHAQNLHFAPPYEVVGGTDLLFDIEVEPNGKRLRERDVYENNSSDLWRLFAS